MGIHSAEFRTIEPPEFDPKRGTITKYRKNYNRFKRQHKAIVKLCGKAEREGKPYSYNYQNGVITLELHNNNLKKEN